MTQMKVNQFDTNKNPEQVATALSHFKGKIVKFSLDYPSDYKNKTKDVSLLAYGRATIGDMLIHPTAARFSQWGVYVAAYKIDSGSHVEIVALGETSFFGLFVRSILAIFSTRSFVGGLIEGAAVDTDRFELKYSKDYAKRIERLLK